MSRRERNPHWRDARQQEDAPELWQRIMRAAQSCSVMRALTALQMSTPEAVDEALLGPLGLITPVIRAAGARKSSKSTAPPPSELLEFVDLALWCGFSANASCPQIMAWEISSPPLVTAASYGYETVCEALLRGGASPASRNSDGETSLHAVEHPHVLRLLLGMSAFRALVNVENKWRLTPLVSALTAHPFKAKHWESAQLLAPAAALSDRDHAILAARRRLPRLAQIAHEQARASGRGNLPTDALCWHPAWHWSFPQADREAVSVLHALAQRGHAGLPPELWLHAFGFITRGWFTPKRDEPLVMVASSVMGVAPGRG